MTAVTMSPGMPSAIMVIQGAARRAVVGGLGGDDAVRQARAWGGG